MAKAIMQAALVKLPDEFGGKEIKFGKGDRIIKLPFPAENPTGILFVGRSGRTFLADFSRYPDAIKAVMVFHGSKQKLGDDYADLEDEADCFEAVIELDARLAEGKWTAERQGFAGISVLMRAIMEVFSMTEQAARDFLKPLTPKEKMGLRVSPELKPTVDKLEAEKGKKADVGGLIEKLKKQQ